jgi:hypothetical protein
MSTMEEKRDGRVDASVVDNGSAAVCDDCISTDTTTGRP